MRQFAAPFNRAIATHGEPFLWYAAYPASDQNPRANLLTRRSEIVTENGFVFIQQTLSETAAKALITEATKRYVDKEFGLMEVGDCKFVCNASLCHPTHGDKIVRTSVTHHLKEAVTKGDDTLTQPFVADVEKVLQANDEVPYVKDTDWSWDGSKIVWSGANTPDEDDSYIAHFTYHPVYWLLDIGTKTTRAEFGQTAPMPFRGTLSLKWPSA